MEQVLSCEFCEIFKSTFFREHLWTTAFDFLTLNSCVSLYFKTGLVLQSSADFAALKINYWKLVLWLTCKLSEIRRRSKFSGFDFWSIFQNFEKSTMSCQNHPRWFAICWKYLSSLIEMVTNRYFTIKMFQHQKICGVICTNVRTCLSNFRSAQT